MIEADNRNPLTDRQMEVLQLVAQGVTNKEIGHALNISENTVRKHLQNIFEKLDVSSRTEATTLAYQRGWMALPAPGSSPGAQPSEEILEGQASGKAQVDQRVAVGLGAAAVVVVVLLIWSLVFREPASSNLSPPVLDIDRWTEVLSLPTPRAGLAAVGFKGHLYAIAGDTPTGPSGLAERFAPRDGEWHRLADKPTPVRDVGAAVIGGKIYVPAGCLANDVPTDVLEVYDPDTDTWSTRARLPEAICGYAIAAVEGDMYVFGGWNGKDYTNHVFAYDPDRDAWAEMSPMPTARAYAGAGAVEGQIYVVGGYNGRRDLDVVEAYAPSNDHQGGDPWTRHAPLPDGRGGAGVVAIRSTLYIIGGGWNAGRETGIEYDVLTDAWSLIANPTPEIWRNMGVAVLDTRSETMIYALGGWAGDFIATNRAYTALYNVQLPLQQR